MTRTSTSQKHKYLHPLSSPKERLALLQSIKGMWKHRKPDPVKELRKMRREWDRKLPSN